MAEPVPNNNIITPGSTEEEATERTFAQIFTSYTGVEITENQETKNFRQAAVAEARAFLSPFVERGQISAEEEQEAINFWGNLVVLNREQYEQYRDFNSAVFEQAIEDLSQSDPEKENPEVQAMIGKLENLLEFSKAKTAIAIVFVDTPDPIRKDQAQQAGMTERWMVINWGKAGKLQPQYRLRELVLEETCHFISKLKLYEQTAGHGWFEEVMSRAVSLIPPSGHNPADADYASVCEDMHLADYSALMAAISGAVGDGSILGRMFFGKEPQDSEGVKRVGETLDKIDLIGRLIEVGVTFDRLNLK